MKIPYLSRLLKIKEAQLEIEYKKIKLLKEIKELLKTKFAEEKSHRYI